MEKNIKKNVYLCITESLCCTAEIKQHCKSTIFQFKKKTKTNNKTKKTPNAKPIHPLASSFHINHSCQRQSLSSPVREEGQLTLEKHWFELRGST